MCIAEDKRRRDPALSPLDVSVDATVAIRSQGVSGWYEEFSRELRVRPQNTEQKLPALTTGDVALTAAFDFDFEH